MLDNTKFLITDIHIINRLLLHPDFIVCKPKNNCYHSLKHKDFGIKLSLDFRKSVFNGEVIGYGHLELNTSPHYHSNNYQHNGNDFTPYDCINSLIDILSYLGIKNNEYESLKVVNMEFGLNIIPETDIKNLINGIFYYKKTPFKVGAFPYFRKTDATSYKQIKAYAKGLQFDDMQQFRINQNTFRFEVKTKQSKNIEKYGINTANDLLNLETYQRLGQTLVNEWENILITNLEPDFTDLDNEIIQGSKFLCFSGLQFYYKNQPNIYDELTEKYLSEEKRETDLKTQFYYLAHNIRNTKTNLLHNRKRFEKRNYNPNQLQFNF